MDRKKQKLLVLAAVVALITLFSRSTLAYYTVTGIATNVVTSGEIRLQIHETDENGDPFPEEGVTVIPGDTVGKVVAVQNVCRHPFWLRVKLVKGSTGESLRAEDALQIVDLNDRDWKLVGDYWYYDEILYPGETTEPLFTQVEINGKYVNQHDIGSALTLTVKAYAVQSENNPAAHPWEVSGWPEA